MAAVIIEIADAVVEELNEVEWSLPFPVQRAYVPIHELRDLKDLTVTVVPKSVKPNLINREGKNLYDYLIDIGIQKVIGVGAMTNDEINAACDPLMALAEEIINDFFLELFPIPSYPTPRCIDAENVPMYHPLHLDEQRVFTTVITLNFRLGK